MLEVKSCLAGGGMQKNQAAAKFFEQLIQGSSDFITQMIESEMDAELIELFNKFAGQLQQGDMETERFQASLLIIGYLVRSHEQRALAADQPPANGAAPVH